MAEGFKIGEGYVEITSRVKDGQVERDAQAVGDSFEENFTKRVEGRTRESRGRFTRAAKDAIEPGGDEAGKGFGRRLVSGIGSWLASPGSRKLFTSELTAPIGEALMGFAKSPVGLAAITAMVASTGTLIASGLSATISAGLVGGIGVGGIGLAGWLLKDKPAIHGLVQSIGHDFSSMLHDSAGVMQVGFVGALDDVKRAIPTIKPLFDTLFKSLAPAVQPFVDGLIGAVQKMSPGLQALAQRSGPFLIDLAKRLPGMGASIGKFFQKIANNWPAIQKSFFSFMHDAGSVIHAIGVAFVFLAAHYGQIKSVFTNTMMVFHMVATAIRVVIAVFHLLGKIPGFISRVWHSITGVFSRGMAQTRARVSSGISQIVGFFRALPGKIIGGIRSLASSIAGVFSRGMAATRARVAAGASQIVAFFRALPGRIRSALSGVRGAVVGAFAGAGGWLVSAGRSIVMGLVNGIRGAIGAAASAAASMAQSAVNAAKAHLHINSPSKLVAREVGRPISEGLAYGFEQEQPRTNRRIARGISTAMPAMAGAATSGMGNSGPSYSTSYSAGAVPINVYASPGMNVDQLSRKVVAALHNRIEQHKRGYR